MSVARQSTLGATRVCPHCKATVLQSANICPGCQHHLRFNTVNAEPAAQAVSAMRIEGTIHHPARGEQCEYCVVIAITNEKGEKITRQVVGVGALQPGERHKYSFSVELVPVRALPKVPPRNNFELSLNHRIAVIGIAAILSCLCAQAAAPASAQGDAVARKDAHDIFKQLIEINTTDSVGSTTVAAQAMSQRLLDAGFAKADVVVLGPNDRKGNMVARYRGKPGSKLKPILIIGHLDVVEAKREDWSTDPFQFVEKDGYFYGRGTQDMKDSDAIAVADFIRMKKEGFVPDRDIILALTADEEGGKSNGVDWLLKNHRELIDAEFALNPDAGGVRPDKPQIVGFEATEKLYADFQVLATNPGGHSSLPVPDNAIYHVADALAALQKWSAPFELNSVTREYFAQMAKIETGQAAADMRAILGEPPDPKAVERLSQDTHSNAVMRTTCVATMLSGGHAPNALPGRAEANVNCRIFPGHSQEDIRLQLVKLFNDPKLTVRYRGDNGDLMDHGSDRKAMAPPPLRDDVMNSLRSVAGKLWPGFVVLPIMEAGASDSIHTMNAGIPSYGICGVAIERADDRAHGRDERVKTDAYYKGVEFYYQFLKALTTPTG